jgi:hypothetical protein
MGGKRASATGMKARLEYFVEQIVLFKEAPLAELLLATASWPPEEELRPFVMGLVIS